MADPQLRLRRIQPHPRWRSLAPDAAHGRRAI